MSQPLYERYKDALRRGHVAGLRGRLETALEAYAEAAELAPDRALPHASSGAILRRLGRLVDARSAYDEALVRAPLDETALRGRAAVLLDAGHRADAADDLERLAEALEAEGRIADAADAARQALDLAESRSRRRLADRLAHRVQTAGSAGEAGAPALAIDGMQSRELHAEDGDARDVVPDVDLRVASNPRTRESEPATTNTASEADGTAVEPPRPPDEPRDPLVLVVEAESFLDAGDVDAARPLLLAALVGYRASGRSDAAIDAGLRLLGVAPADLDLHLALAELQLDRGWRVPAADKLRLLARLADLTGDDRTRAAAAALSAARLEASGAD